MEIGRPILAVATSDVFTRMGCSTSYLRVDRLAPPAVVYGKGMREIDNNPGAFFRMRKFDYSKWRPVAFAPRKLK